MKLLNGAAATLGVAFMPRSYPFPTLQPTSLHLIPIICLCNKDRPPIPFLRLGNCILPLVRVPTTSGMSLSYLFRTPILPLPSILPRGLSACLCPALKFPVLATCRIMGPRFCSLHLIMVNTIARLPLFNVSTLCRRYQL